MRGLARYRVQTVGGVNHRARQLRRGFPLGSRLCTQRLERAIMVDPQALHQDADRDVLVAAWSRAALGSQ